MKNLRREPEKAGQWDAARYSKEGGRSVFVIVAFLLFGGCKCADKREEDLARLPRASGTLQDQLAAEAAARPADTGTLEALTASLAKEGITFNAPRQGFGRKLLATYCASADSTSGMIVTVCEYPSPEQASRGEAEAKIIGAQLAGFQSRTSKKSVLQIVARSDTPPEQVAKVLSIFEGL
jgi:hypothetical protein